MRLYIFYTCGQTDPIARSAFKASMQTEERCWDCSSEKVGERGIIRQDLLQPSAKSNSVTSETRDKFIIDDDLYGMTSG